MAFRRQASRQLGKLLSMGGAYKGAKRTRLNAGWLTRTESQDISLYGELEDLRNRTRDLNRNDPIAAGATDTLVVNVVKNGLVPQSRIRSKSLGMTDEQAADYQQSAEDIYDKWTPWASSSGTMDINEIQAMAIRQIVESGEFLAVRRALPTVNGRPYFLALDLIEPDRLGPSYLTPVMSQKQRFGITFDDNGAPIKYQIAKTHPGDMGGTPLEFTDVPAKDTSGRPLVFHLFPYKRPGQSRGVPFFAPVIDYFKTLSDYIEAELVAARIAACFAAFITSQSDPYSMAMGRSGDTLTDATGKGQRVESLEPGMIEYLKSGETISFAEPKKPGDTFDSFVERLIRLIGTALGLPYELILKDFSKTNYSSARAALIQAYRFFQVWQNFLRKKLCQPLWELLLEEAWLRGELPAPGFLEKKFEYCRSTWILPGWPYVNPLDEVNANENAIKMGIKSRAQVCAEQGDDWEEIAEQIGREKTKFEGLSLPWEGVDAAAKKAKPAQQPSGGDNALPP